MSFPKYPKYKDSGVEWLGEVPENWDIRRLKKNFTLINEKSSLKKNPVALENIESWTGKYFPTEGDFSSDGVVFEIGDILFGKLRPYLAKVYLAEFAGEAVGDFYVLRPKSEINAKFAQYQILNKDFISIVDGSTYGSKMPRASWDFIGAIFLATPPKCEQIIIADFLANETSKIDSLICEQKNLIELLKEKRQAVISHAVTKGLNPNAPMKDSGVEWLGEVPEHWEAKKLKHIGDAFIGLTYNPTEIVDETEGTLVLRSSNVQKGHITFDDNVYVNKKIPNHLITRRGDILICSRNGSRNLIGKNAKIGIDSEEVTFGAFMTIFRSNLNTFLYWIFNSYIFEMQSASFLTSTINQLTIGNLNNFNLLIPPSEEQEEIMSYLDQETSKIDSLISEANKGIDLLKERRSALISSAVTGKIDVRSFVEKSESLEAA